MLAPLSWVFMFIVHLFYVQCYAQHFKAKFKAGELGENKLPLEFLGSNPSSTSLAL